MAKAATFILDNVSGLFELAKASQWGEITEQSFSRGDFGMKWDPVMAINANAARLSNRMAEMGINVVWIAHVAPDYMNMGPDPENPKRQLKRLLGWDIQAPGSGPEAIRQPFDECYHLVTRPNEAGTQPQRILHVNEHMFQGAAFKAKSRFKAKGPILGLKMDDGYGQILKNLPDQSEVPRKFIICGEAGAGKTTLAFSFPQPIVALDMYGGCDVAAKGKDALVIKPKDADEVYKVLLKVSKGQDLDQLRVAA